jgi:Protein of unknown function (DUF2726)
VIVEGQVVIPEVSYMSLFTVKGGTGSQGARNRIIQKRVDFVIYDQQSMKPVCAIELDDASHDQPDRRTRDAFADGLFRHARLPLVHVRAASSYDASEVARALAAALRPDAK